MKNLEYALYYAGNRGWAVLPCHWITDCGRCSCGKADCGSAGKHPRTRHGVKDATTDIEQICEWWEKWPQANVAIATGKISNLFVLDIDVKANANGFDTLENLEGEIGSCRSVLCVDTPSGGQHHYFEYPDEKVKNSVQKIGLGIDIRSDNGYVLAPPSNHIAGGVYKFAKGEKKDD